MSELQNTKKQSRRFLLYFFSIAFLLLGVIGMSVYFIDPFFQYRTKDKTYLLNPIYVNPGLARNYDYNTVIIGSSMVQNYDLSILKKEFPKMRPLKLGSGAMTITETEELYSNLRMDSVDTFIINIDMIQLNEWHQLSKYPEYLFSKNILDRLRYHYAYESVVRYGLADLILGLYLRFVDYNNLPDKLKYRITIDDIGNFKYDAVYNSADFVKETFISRSNLSYPNKWEMKERIEYNIDRLFDVLKIDEHSDKEYIFVIPPYSVLYWTITQIDEYYDYLMDGLVHFTKLASKYPNVKVQCFYTLPTITDLNAYSDVSHFDPNTSNFILQNVKNNIYSVDSLNIEERVHQLDSIIRKYRTENSWAN